MTEKEQGAQDFEEEKECSAYSEKEEHVGTKKGRNFRDPRDLSLSLPIMEFSIEAKDGGSDARKGSLRTAHGEIRTPVFMPVGTTGSVKGVWQRDLREELDVRILLGNTYHLLLRPGTELLEEAGGLHRFMSWDRPILTDSGGYQVYSLASERELDEDGVRFRSHVDGQELYLSPESAIDVQRSIGGDIIMAFDECTSYPASKEETETSMELTHRWLERSCERFDATEPLYGHDQALFPIVQGGVYPELRERSASFIASMDRPGNAIGGLSVGEPEELMYEMTERVCAILPEDRPRYLMGVGTPANIIRSVMRGVDMFDCVMPTRNARNGMLFTRRGIINIRNRKWRDDHSPLDPEGSSSVDLEYSKAYLRHLMLAKEMLGPMIATLHNLAFYSQLMKDIRHHIEKGDLKEWGEDLARISMERL